ncbi:MAG: ABC transporter substrate-binding protein [Candidatus Midichloria sp.]|nr:MAG: ABC transporter substrate-binding protein [Candidatus Midichloria sp.]
MKFKYVITFALLFIYNNSFADTKKNIEDFVDNNARRVISVLEEKISDNAKKEKLAALFYEIVDYEWIGKFVIAKNWNGMNRNQKNHYLEAYKKYLSNLYVKKFVDYNNQQYKIVDISNIGKSHFIAATKIINTWSSKPRVNVAYRIKDSNNVLKIVDIIGEGVSLLSTQRADFSSIIEQKGINNFLKILERKVNKDILLTP